MPHDLLAKIPLFSVLSGEEREELTALLEARTFPSNHTLVWVGEPGDDFFIIENGTVEISAPDGDGKSMTLGLLGPGQFFGEISLLDGGSRTATVRANSELSVLCLNRENFLKFLRRHPDAAIHMLTILGKRQRETVERLRGIRNANEAIEARQTSLQRAAQRIANIGASEIFLLVNLMFFATWIVMNTVRVARGIKPFDEPPTFFTLGFIITLEAILLSMCVLNSQRQQAERDRIRADLDYQVNVKAHKEVMSLHQKMDRVQVLLVRLIGTDAIRHHGLTEHVEQMTRDTARSSPILPVLPSDGRGSGTAGM